MKTRLSMMALAVASALAACGGSSDPTGTAAISTTNQTAIAQDVLSAAMAPVSGATLMIGVQSVSESAVYQFSRSLVDKLPAYFAQARAGAALAGVVQSTTVPCSGGGTLALTVTDADNSNTLSAGDTVAVVATACVEGADSISGTVSFVVNQLAGTLGSANSSANLTVTFTNLAVLTGATSVAVAGDLTLGLSQSSTALNEELSANTLTATATYGGTSRTRTLTGYHAHLSTVASTSTPPAVSTYEVNGLVASSAISAQTFFFRTITPMVRTGTNAYPSSGVVTATGANNSRLRITAISATQATLEVDADGDGTYESSSTVNWTTLG